MDKTLLIKQEVIDSILTYAKMCHPRECILLLRGREAKDKIEINEVEIPPFSTHGEHFASFPLNMLPIDLSVKGTAHSHPSGVLKPSGVDLNKFYGRVVIIAAHPYDSEENLAAFNRTGNTIKYQIV